jgi:hypothetical protein
MFTPALERLAPRRHETRPEIKSLQLYEEVQPILADNRYVVVINVAVAVQVCSAAAAARRFLPVIGHRRKVKKVYIAITADPNTQSGPVQTWHYQDQNNHYWQYQVQADDPNALADYTDGLYTITVTYQTGGNDTTTLEFADPNTGAPIPQPTQQPVLTAPENNATVASPVTFTWQPCNDRNVTSISLDLENQDADDDLSMLLSPDDSRAGPASLTPGTWQAQLSFDNFIEFDNPDGVPVSAGKFTTSDCTFDVRPEEQQP